MYTRKLNYIKSSLHENDIIHTSILSVLLFPFLGYVCNSGSQKYIANALCRRIDYIIV